MKRRRLTAQAIAEYIGTSDESEDDYDSNLSDDSNQSNNDSNLDTSATYLSIRHIELQYVDDC